MESKCLAQNVYILFKSPIPSSNILQNMKYGAKKLCVCLGVGIAKMLRTFYLDVETSIRMAETFRAIESQSIGDPPSL